MPDSITRDCLIREYRDLIQTLVARRIDLGLTQEELADRAGLQDGYCGKIEGTARRLGGLSLPLVLEALGVSLVVVTDSGETVRRARPGESRSFATLVGTRKRNGNAKSR